MTDLERMVIEWVHPDDRAKVQAIVDAHLKEDAERSADSAKVAAAWNDAEAELTELREAVRDFMVYLEGAPIYDHMRQVIEEKE